MRLKSVAQSMQKRQYRLTKRANATYKYKRQTPPQQGGLFVRLDIDRGPESCYSASAYILPFSICVEVHASYYSSAQAKVARFELQTFHWSLQYIENRRQAKCLEINRERDLMQNMQNTKERWHDFDQDSD